MEETTVITTFTPTEGVPETTNQTTESIPNSTGIVTEAVRMYALPVTAVPTTATSITTIHKTGENYLSDERRFYMILKVNYFDEQGELSKKICHANQYCEILGIYNDETETIEFDGEFHPSHSVSPCEIEGTMKMHIDFYFLLHRNPNTDTIYNVFKHLIKPGDLSDISEIAHFTTSTEIWCEGILSYTKNINNRINIKYTIERMNKTKWVLGNVKYSITKKLWNDLLKDAINMHTYMTSKDKTIFFV